MKESSDPFVVTLDLQLADKLLKELVARHFAIEKPPYTRFSGKTNGISCTLYESGKLVVQGKKAKEFIEFFLEPEILSTFTYGNKAQIEEKPHIGIDESGKGDLYGPLCIAGVYVPKEGFAALQAMKIRDSKQVSDKEVKVIAQKIRAQFKHALVRLSPSKYNQLYQNFKNLNRLLAWGHATAIEQLTLETGCRVVTIDQFAAQSVVENALAYKGLQLELTQRHRAEEDPVVAAASILARHAFLEGLERLSEEWGILLPKGAAPVVIKVGKQLVAKHGPEVLEKTAKMHFKTIREILE